MANQLTKLAAMFLIFAVILAPGGGQAQTSECDSVLGVLSVCRNYILSGGPVPRRGSQCCEAIKSFAKVPTRASRQAICGCLNKITAMAKNAQIKNAAKLPKSCGVKLPFAIKRNINCSRVK